MFRAIHLYDLLICRQPLRPPPFRSYSAVKTSHVRKRTALPTIQFHTLPIPIVPDHSMALSCHPVPLPPFTVSCLVSHIEASRLPNLTPRQLYLPIAIRYWHKQLLHSLLKQASVPILPDQKLRLSPRLFWHTSFQPPRQRSNVSESYSAQAALSSSLTHAPGSSSQLISASAFICQDPNPKSFIFQGSNHLTARNEGFCSFLVQASIVDSAAQACTVQENSPVIEFLKGARNSQISNGSWHCKVTA